MTDENPEDTAPPEGAEAPPEAEDPRLLGEQLDEALREKDQFRAMAQRAQADLENFKRRAAEERDETRRNATSRLLLKVLSIVDDLDRGLALVPEDAAVPGWLEGMHLVQRNLSSILDSEGVTRIEAEGKPFEPREHEAVFYEETSDGQEGTVVKVIREGYKVHDRVLRAAQVAVSRAPEEPNQPAPTQEEA